MTGKFARYSALVLAAVIVLGILFPSRIGSWFEGDRALASSTKQQERAVDDMSNMPGMGNSQQPASTNGGMTQPAARSIPQRERKVL